VPWDEDLASDATIEITDGTPDPRLVASHLGNGNPALGCRILGTQGAIRFAHASSVSCASVHLIHHNLDEGFAIRVEGDTDPAFASPDYAVDFTIGARTIDGYRNDWVDLVAALGSAPSAPYQRIVADTEDNSVNLAIGSVVLAGAKRTLPQWLLLEDHQISETFEPNVLRTYARVRLAHPADFRVTTFAGALFAESASEVQTIIDWFRRLGGGARPTIVVPDDTEDETFYGVLSAGTQTRRHMIPEVGTGRVTYLSWTFEELSRGLTWEAVA
jgi:hypothetical protein